MPALEGVVVVVVTQTKSNPRMVPNQRAFYAQQMESFSVMIAQP